MTALKLEQAEKGPTLPEVIMEAYATGISDKEIIQWLELAISIHAGKCHTILTQRDVKNRNQLYIKGLKA